MLKTIINILILLILPFILTGTIRKTKAFFAGKKGASVFQPLYDFIKLMKKECVYSKTTSFVFRIAPYITFSSIVFAALLTPLITGYAIINLPFSFVIFSYVLAFGKFFSLIGALDTGSSFEGMGASREACFSTLVEPAFFIIMGSICAITSINTFENLKLILQNSGVYGILIIAFAILALFIMLLIEGCRVPVDDPATHLELTMIHEVMILDNSGADLAFILYSSSLKMFIFEGLIASLLIPSNLKMFPALLLFIAVVFLISIIIGIVESMMARLRMSHVFEFIFIMTILSLLILTFVTYKIYGT